MPTTSSGICERLHRRAVVPHNSLCFWDHLEEALRDCFVCGLTSETTQKWLLTEKDLTFTGAIDIAHGMESAAKALQGGTQLKEVTN